MRPRLLLALLVIATLAACGSDSSSSEKLPPQLEKALAGEAPQRVGAD